MVTSVGDDEKERKRESSKGVLRNAPAAVGFISDLCLTSSLCFHCVSRGVVVSNFLLFFSFDSFFILLVQTRSCLFFSITPDYLHRVSLYLFSQIARDVLLHFSSLYLFFFVRATSCETLRDSTRVTPLRSIVLTEHSSH